MADAVERQVVAYNAHDVDEFVACYAADAEVEDAEGNVVMRGRADMREKYGRRFAESPELRAEVLTRIRVESYVIDVERVTGGRDGEVYAVAVYRLDADGLIERVRFLR